MLNFFAHIVKQDRFQLLIAAGISALLIPIGGFEFLLERHDSPVHVLRDG
jgi:hypothetical protein